MHCATILKAMSSGYEINEKIFSEYAIETAKLLVKEHPWYYLPASVHKILLHGSSVISAALILLAKCPKKHKRLAIKTLKILEKIILENVLGLKQMRTCYMDY